MSDIEEYSYVWWKIRHPSKKKLLKNVNMYILHIFPHRNMHRTLLDWRVFICCQILLDCLFFFLILWVTLSISKILPILPIIFAITSNIAYEKCLFAAQPLIRSSALLAFLDEKCLYVLFWWSSFSTAMRYDGNWKRLACWIYSWQNAGCLVTGTFNEAASDKFGQLLRKNSWNCRLSALIIEKLMQITAFWVLPKTNYIFFFCFSLPIWCCRTTSRPQMNRAARNHQMTRIICKIKSPRTRETLRMTRWCCISS